jgi:hypothetical protein
VNEKERKTMFNRMYATVLALAGIFFSLVAGVVPLFFFAYSRPLLSMFGCLCLALLTLLAAGATRSSRVMYAGCHAAVWLVSLAACYFMRDLLPLLAALVVTTLLLVYNDQLQRFFQQVRGFPVRFQGTMPAPQRDEVPQPKNAREEIPRGYWPESPSRSVYQEDGPTFPAQSHLSNAYETVEMHIPSSNQ